MATIKFYDDFTSPLALWISPQTGGTWHSPDTWEESGNSPTGNTNDWWIDPLYPATSQADANPFAVANSVLTINVIKTPADVPAAAVGNCPYISGKLVTNGRFQTTYGYFEARIKMPKGNGFGAAFWLNPHDGAGWPPEIDITEMVSINPTITTFAVWSNDYGSPATNRGGYLDTRTVDLTADYHYYALNWQSDFMTWYLDGQQLFQQPTPSDCHQDFYVILDTTAGMPAGWGGAPDSTTPFPGQMQIDYVAVWDVSPYAGGGGGTGAGLNLNSGGGGGGTSSPDGTVLFKGDGTSITDANNHVWTINGSGQVTVDGAADLAAPTGVTELAYVGGSVWRFIQQIPYITPDSGSFTDSAGNVYTITSAGGDVATENGQPMSGGSGTGAMGYYLGTVYAQDEVSGGWFTWDGVQFNNATIVPPLPGSAWARKTLPTNSWVSGTNPLTAAAYTSTNNSTVSLGSASKLVASDGSAYGLVNTSGGGVVANGVADTSLTGVTEIAYVSGNLWRFQSSTGLWWFETSAAGPWQPTGGTAVSPLPVQTTKRAPADQPFSSTSVWNIGIGSGATWGVSTDADVQQLVSLTGNVLGATNGQPIFFGAPSDPLVQITCTDTTFPVPAQLVHVPLGSVPSGPNDGWMNFFDFSQPTRMWSYAGCRLTNGVDVTGGITAAKGGVWDCSGDGVANAINPGSDYNFLVGTITDYDLLNGVIQHALRFSLGVDALKSPGSTWTGNIPWPGTHEDLSGPTAYKGNITYGCTIGIPASTVLPSLSRGGTWLATALQKYGAICRIGSAVSGSINFYTTPANDQNQNIVQMRGDMAKIVPLLKIMRNQAPATINGGGNYPPQIPPVDTNPVYYQPQYRPVGTTTWTNFGRPVKDTNVVITGLSPATQYEFEVVAFNARGSLISTLVGDATTGSGSLSITGITLSSSTIPAGSPVGTVVGIVSVSMSGGSFSGAVTIGGTNASSFSLTGNSLATKVALSQGSYSITLTASQGGVAPFTQPETIVAQSSLAGPPTNITSPSQTSTQVVLSWSPPTIGAKLDTGVYQVQYKTTVSGVWLNGPTIPYCTPGSGSFTDLFGNTWLLNTSNHPVINGNIDTASNAGFLLTFSGLVWQEDTAGNWYSLTPSGTITDTSALPWSAPTTTSPLTDVVVSGLSASTGYNFQVYVSNTAGNGPAASSSPTVISTAAASSQGPVVSGFITADFAAPSNYPNGGSGQTIVSQKLWGASSGAAADSGFGMMANAAVTAAAAKINWGLHMFVDVPWLNADLSINTSLAASLLANFPKWDPLGISAIVMGLDFNAPNVNGDPNRYGTGMANLYRYLSTATMSNGKALPLLGMTGHNEPDGNYDEATAASYYNAAITACRAVNSNVQFYGPMGSFLRWFDFATQTSNRLTGFMWDAFPTGGNPSPTDTSLVGTTEFSQNFHDASSNTTDSNLRAYMVGGYSISSLGASIDTNSADNSYPMALATAKWAIDALNNSRLPVYMCKWTHCADTINGFTGTLDVIDGNGNICPHGWFTAQAVRKVFGSRWQVPTAPAGFYTLAVSPSAGHCTLLAVNYGGGAQNNKTVAFSRWPVNGNGNGTASVWQLGTQSQTYTATDPATVNPNLTFTGGVSAPMNFPDPSITIISV
jgi:beta-glucanase (GH16 family)